MWLQQHPQAHQQQQQQQQAMAPAPVGPQNYTFLPMSNGGAPGLGQSSPSPFVFAQPTHNGGSATQPSYTVDPTASQGQGFQQQPNGHQYSAPQYPGGPVFTLTNPHAHLQSGMTMSGAGGGAAQSSSYMTTAPSTMPFAPANQQGQSMMQPAQYAYVAPGNASGSSPGLHQHPQAYPGGAQPRASPFLQQAPLAAGGAPYGGYYAPAGAPATGPPNQAPQVILLPNGQYAILQPMPTASVAPGPQLGGHGYTTSPQRVTMGGSLTVMPSASSTSGGTPIGSTSLTAQPQLMMPMFVPPQPASTSSIVIGGDSGSPGASTSRTPAQLGGSIHNASSSTRPQCDPAQWGYAVVDPYHTSLQRVPVPPSVITTTRGVTLYNNDVSISSTKPCTSHVCLRHITSGGCPLGEACTSFHIAGSYIDQARACTDPLCCGLHNDYFSQEMMRAGCAPHIPDSKFTLVLEDRSEVELLPAQLAFTAGLEHLSIRGSSRIIQFRKQVCRLHLDGRCKWTKDCGHVHLCRELHRMLGTFHYPSLVFLLSTENDEAKLAKKLEEVADFIKSRSCMPLTHQLIVAGRANAVSAMAAIGAKFTGEMAAAAMSKLAVVVPETSIVSRTDFATEAIHPELRRPFPHQQVSASAAAMPFSGVSLPLVIGNAAPLHTVSTDGMFATGPTLAGSPTVTAPPALFGGAPSTA